MSASATGSRTATTTSTSYGCSRPGPCWSRTPSRSSGARSPCTSSALRLGDVGVLVFFAVSGLLIRRSWEYDPSPRDFWIKRALRLLPALATVAVVTAFVLGPLVTTRSPVVVLLLVGDVDLPRAGHPPLHVRRAAPGRLRGQPLPGRQRPTVEPPGRGLRLRLPLPARRDRPAGPAVAGHRPAGLSLVWAAGGCPSPSTASARSTSSRPSRVGAAAYSWRDRIVLAWPVALALVPACVAAGLGPEPAPGASCGRSAAVYLSYWFAYAVPPVGRRARAVG